jgi:hypothetical protein
MQFINIDIFVPPQEAGQEPIVIPTIWNTEQIAAVFRVPMQPTWVLTLPGGFNTPVITPYDSVTSVLKEEGFLEFEIPEGTLAYVAPKHILHLNEVQLGVTAIVWNPQSRLVVKEGIHTLTKKLNGKPGIEIA